MIEADITITNNADWSIPLIFTDEATGASYDFTGDTFKMHVRASASSPVTSLALTTANGGVASTDLSAGKITLEIGKGDLDPGSYVYDLIRVTGSAEEYLVGGALTVSDGVTT
ncbi:hypothetical protein CSC94_05850 [Zhengella mangrovi]|uniref:Uncharacterized protein n=1 Tax=Zhengella mangrovi TaxID=1982044 RepID=A0A2G1QRM1_9HYPH|nr:hypothetical protein [Zhengella mangrovi]PHP68173.1 hypothetical protein CSC94_05850 [Zhengella mangrovi]